MDSIEMRLIKKVIQDLLRRLVSSEYPPSDVREVSDLLWDKWSERIIIELAAIRGERAVLAKKLEDLQVKNRRM